jgi:hypothetical protein
MIDWYNLAANSLWILGCAVSLATLSYASWEASILDEKFITRLKRPSYQIALSLAGLLFCTGLAGTSDSTLEIILWSILSLAFLVQMVATYWQKRKADNTYPPTNPQI